jgi:hypothetical protein
MMGLALSAAGVTSVNLSSPFAKKIAKEVQQARSEASSNPAATVSYPPTFGQVNTTAWNGSNNSPGLLQTTPQGLLDAQSVDAPYQVEAFAPVDAKGGRKTPFSIPLWALIAPICCIGILLWMTPMPTAQSTRRRGRR